MPSIAISPYLLPILLLVGSNVFMTIAWYGHLRFKETSLVTVIVASWLIAFVEYCMAVPANRWGSAGLHHRPAQDDPGDRHLADLCGLLGALSERADDLELRRRLRIHRGGSVLRLSRTAVRCSGGSFLVYQER